MITKLYVDALCIQLTGPVCNITWLVQPACDRYNYSPIELPPPVTLFRG